LTLFDNGGAGDVRLLQEYPYLLGVFGVWPIAASLTRQVSSVR